jgi:hypothetical protein
MVQIFYGLKYPFAQKQFVKGIVRERDGLKPCNARAVRFTNDKRVGVYMAIAHCVWSCYAFPSEEEKTTKFHKVR